jgi:hypothetical protein
MDFSENYDHSISLDEAAKMTKAYRDSMPKDSPIAATFSKSALKNILDQAGCAGIRMYYAKGADKKLTLVLTGMKAEGGDIYEGRLAEMAQLCPPFCSPRNPLNS